MDEIGTLAAALAGQYAIERKIGAGGMATVYLARDLKHNRRVAVKMLRPELGVVLGPERFLTEIQVTANLQHPNLLPLFDSGAVEGLLYYVMPYVDGETLRDRLNREKQLPVDEALGIAVAVASALEYAHGHGVIHRDLKPENILMQGDQPIVADFGIALAVSIAGGPRVTQSGMSLGTPQYMSPEQATGDRTLDARADIFSLGAVVYEMLTGETPHAAPTAQATIAKLLTEEARSIVALRRAVPEHVDYAVHRALEKLPADRFTSARSFSEALQGKAHVTRPPSAARAVHRESPWRSNSGRATAGMLVVAGAFGLWQWQPWAGNRARPTRNALAFVGAAKYEQGNGGIRVALSPDGEQLAYVGAGATNPVYLKRFDEVEPKRLAGVEGVNLQFSADGQYLAFVGGGGENNTLYKVQLPDGVPITVADSANRYSWGDGDIVIFVRAGTGRPDALWRTRASGGSPEPLAEPNSSRGERHYTWPHVLPGGKAVLFNISYKQRQGLDSLFVAAVRLEDRIVVPLGIAGSNPRFVSTGHLLYTLPTGVVMAVSFDPVKLQVGKESPVPVLENVLVRASGATQYTVSANGSLVYVNEGAAAQLVVTDRSGRELARIADSGRTLGMGRFSPDGKRIAFVRGNPTAPNIWLYDRASGTTSQLTSDGRSFGADWSANGRRVAWTDMPTQSTRWQPWDASEPPAILLDSARTVQFSPDGKFLTAVGPGGDSRGRFFVALSNMRRREPFVLRGLHLPHGTSVSQFEISPDSKWLAFAAIPDGTTNNEVFVQRYPATGVAHRISVDGGTAPIWGATSSELFYRHRGQLWSVTLTTTPAFSVSRRDSLFAMNVIESPNVSMYDASPDGRSFVMPKFLGEQNPPPVHVTNWFVELKERVASARARR